MHPASNANRMEGFQPDQFNEKSIVKPGKVKTSTEVNRALRTGGIGTARVLAGVTGGLLLGSASVSIIAGDAALIGAVAAGGGFNFLACLTAPPVGLIVAPVHLISLGVAIPGAALMDFATKGKLDMHETIDSLRNISLFCHQYR